MDVEQPTIGPKPAEGLSGSPLLDAGKIYLYDSTGRIKEVRGTSAPLGDATYNADLTNSSARIGDYVIQNGQPVAVPNSPTDLAQKYQIAIGGSGLTSQEAVAQSVSLSNIGGNAAVGAAIGGTFFGPAGALVGGLAGALNAYNTAGEEALKNWQNENIKYDTAVEFYRDDDGTLKYKLDYQKMGTGGPLSGEGVKEAQERKTEVFLGDDGRLKVTVSPIFATTARFEELMKWISENYAGLSKDTENYEQIIEEIKNGIDGEAQSYITNMKLYADYSSKFPDASPEAIVTAYMTEAAGYIDPEKMADFSMTIVGDNGLETKTAKAFFDSVLKMNKDDRNRLLERLNDIVYGDNDYGVNEKAVAFGEIRALYAVSNNSEGYEDDKYQGMLDADAFNTFFSSFAPLGLNVADVLNFVTGGNFLQTKQEFLNQNDFAKFVGIVGSVGAGFGLWKGGTALIEKGLKLLPGTSQLFNASLEGQEGGAIAFFAQNAGNSQEVLKASAASAAFKTLKVGIFDAALSGTKTLVSGTDFLSEFGQDFARDAILEAVFSYYDMVQFEKAVNESVVLVAKDPKTGDIISLPVTESQGIIDDSLELVGAYSAQKTRAGGEAGIIQSERGTTYYYNGTAVTVTPSGEVQKMLAAPDGMTDGIPALKTGVVVTPEVTSTEVSTVQQALENMGLPKDAEVFSLPAQSAAAAEAAGKIAKFDTSKVGLAINTNLFNKNAALDTVNEIALAKTGDLTAWQNRSQKFVSVTDNARQEINLMKTGAYIQSSEKAFSDYQMTLGELNLTKRYTKIDADFLKASIQLERAAFLDRHKVEGDTRDYTAEALEKYGEAIARVPEDRAAVLRSFNEIRKARHDATKLSAKKSGKIDVKKLDSFTDSDLQKEIGWVPQWGKRQTYSGLLNKYYGISQERNIYKEWLPEGGWVDLDKLEDPVVADDRFLNFVATNMGITDMIENTASALSDADLLVDNTPTSKTLREKQLASIKNKDELKNKFTEMVEAKKKEIKEKVPSQKQYKDLMEKNIKESKVLESIERAISSDITEDLSTKFPYNVKTYAPDKLFRGETGREGDTHAYTPDEKYARTYSNDIIHPDRELKIIKLDNVDVGRYIGRKINEYRISSGWRPKSSADLRRVQQFEQLPTDGAELSKLFNTQKIPKIVKEALDDLGIDGVEIPGGMFPSHEDGPKGLLIGHQTEVIKFEWMDSHNPLDTVIGDSEVLLDNTNEYNKIFGYDFDVTSYMNTEYLPNLREALNAKDIAMASAIVNKAVLDIAPYRSQSELLKSAQDSVAEEWREWAEKHIKAGKASSKDLKKFVDDNDLKLPDDKRPYPAKVKHALWERLQSSKKLPKIEGLDVSKISNVSNDANKEIFYKALDETPLFQSATKDKKELVDLVAAEINGETTDAYEMGAATTASGLGDRYPITWYRNGRPYTRFITYRNKEEQRLAEAITELFTDKQLIKQPGVISRVASFIANDFRLLTTGFDPTRAPLNFARDTGRGQITSGGQSFINPNKVFRSLLEVGDYTPAEKEKLSKALDNVANMVGGETYNAAYRTGRKTTTQATKQYLSKTGANPLRRFTYSLVHDKRSIAEAPADFFEGLTRKRLAKSAAVVKLRQLQKEGANFKEQLKGMTDAAFFAGREYTANFARKGKLIEQTSKYIAYQSSAYAGLNGMKMAFINNPEGVSKNFAVFLIAYLTLLADTLGDEDSRKNYYRLSEYDRGNSLVISLGDDTVLTVPLDQEVAAFLFPYRRFMETLNGVDPVSFFEFVWGTLTEPLPMDLSGFSEGEGFNLVRGIQKLTSQNMPNVIAGIQEASTGYDLYYGSDISVSDETLKDYGIYAPEAGDYTTAGKNSLTLRAVANATGIPQWQLQAMVSNYGGNVGSYILNILDKLQGATDEEQGGKDFANAIFKSFVATDQDAAQSAFYDGLQQLRLEKRKLVQKIANYNEDIKTASGDAKVELQVKLQKAKDDYAVKVADFVDKYVSAYEITGGLPKSQAMQIYYLFRLDDDDTVYEEGSPEQYYKTKAEQKFKNQATAMSAPILDKYYNNRIGNIYQDANGNWRRYLSSGVQAMRNSIYGESEEHMVNLLNILEGKDSSLKNLRTKIKDARNKAYEAKDWDTRDALGYELDKQVINAISPYIEKYGAENVLGTNEVLDYLSDWFIVPDDFIKTKKGKYVSLGNNASTQEAFVRPYIKYVFGLPTNYYSYSDTSLTSPSLEDFGR